MMTYMDSLWMMTTAYHQQQVRINECKLIGGQVIEWTYKVKNVVPKLNYVIQQHTDIIS